MLLFEICVRPLYTCPDHWQAVDSRDALAKAIYAGLFDWLVEKVNKSLEAGKRRTGRSISILDIYGFESFKVVYFLSHSRYCEFFIFLYIVNFFRIFLVASFRETVLSNFASTLPMRGCNSILTAICSS